MSPCVRLGPVLLLALVPLGDLAAESSRLRGDGAIVGRCVPIDPVGGEGRLPPAERADLETSIIADALENG